MIEQSGCSDWTEDARKSDLLLVSNVHRFTFYPMTVGKLNENEIKESLIRRVPPRSTTVMDN